jgi:hypothetical protein
MGLLHVCLLASIFGVLVLSDVISVLQYLRI